MRTTKLIGPALAALLATTAADAQNSYAVQVASGGTYVSNWNQPPDPLSIYNGLEAGTTGPSGFTLGWISPPFFQLTDPQILFYTSAAYAVWKGQVFGQSNGGAAVWDFAAGLFHAPLAIPPEKVPFVSSAALGACDFQQVGWAQTAENFNGSGGTANTATITHAMLWNGPGSIAIDLHNSQVSSTAVACDGGRQVGEADNNNGTSHAVLWTGTAKSQIDLHSGPFSSSFATGIGGGLQGGWGSNIQDVPNFQGVLIKSPVHHALIWRGSPGTIQDVNPAGFAESMIVAVGAGKQIGWARPVLGFGPIHAMVWSGSAATVIDLHQLLPAGFIASRAIAIDPVTGVILGLAYTNGLQYAVTWTPQ